MNVKFWAWKRVMFVSSSHVATSNHLYTSVPGDSIPSSGLMGHCAHTWYTNMHADKTLIHLKSFKKYFKTLKFQFFVTTYLLSCMYVAWYSANMLTGRFISF